MQTSTQPAVSSFEFEQSLEDLETRTRSGTRNQSAQNHSDSEIISRYAAQQGLPNDDLRRCLDLAVLPTSLDQKSRQSIIKSLYPAQKVSPGIVHTVASSLGLGAQKTSLTIQQLLLKWLIMLHPLLESPRSVSCIYGAFFNLLDITGLRSNLAHYLAMITLKKHVKPFRIHMLQSLLHTAPRELSLDKLCQIYEQYAPGHLDLPKPKNNITFAHPDLAWAARLQSIHQQASGQKLAPGSFSTPFEFSIRVNDQTMEGRTSNYDITDMDDPKDIAEHLESLQNPVIVARDLQRPLMQQFFMLQPEGNDVPEINALFDELCQQQLEKLADGDELDVETLGKVLDFVRFSKVLPHQVSNFLQEYLPHWDGNRNQSLILGLLSYLPIRPFEELQTTHLHALESALLQSPPPRAQTRLLNFYTSLIHNWTAHLLAQSTPATPAQQTTLLALNAHTAILTLRILVHPIRPPPTTATASSNIAIPDPDPDPKTSILSHLLSFLPLIQPPPSLPLPPPAPLVIYTLLLSPPTLSTLNTTCSLLASYKHAFDSPPPDTSSSSTTNRPPSHIQTLNSCLIDTCNLLFRTRAFDASDTLASGCFLGITPPFSPSPTTSPIIQQPQSQPPSYSSSHATRTALETYISTLGLRPGLNNLADLFGLSCHPALVGLSIAALRAAEAEAERDDNDNDTITPTNNNNKKGQNTKQQTKRPPQHHHHKGPVTSQSLANLAKAKARAQAEGDSGSGGKGKDVNMSWREYRILVLRWLDEVGVTGIGELGRATMKTTLGSGIGIGDEG